jgi:hypothetical protein
MFGHNLIKIHARLRKIGLCESERSFSLWLGRDDEYLRDHRRRAGCGRVSPATVQRLRLRLDKVAELVSNEAAQTLRGIIRDIDRDTRVAAMLAR